MLNFKFVEKVKDDCLKSFKNNWARNCQAKSPGSETGCQIKIALIIVTLRFIKYQPC